MALKVKAQEKLQKIGTYAGKYRYIMMPELYTSLSQDKVIGMLGCSRRGYQGVGHRRSLRSSAWSGHHAIRTACQERRKG